MADDSTTAPATEPAKLFTVASLVAAALAVLCSLVGIVALTDWRWGLLLLAAWAAIATVILERLA